MKYTTLNTSEIKLKLNNNDHLIGPIEDNDQIIIKKKKSMLKIRAKAT